MRIKFFICIAFVLLLYGCQKDNLPVNFTCMVNGTQMRGNAATSYYPYASPQPTFQIIMTGPNSQSVTITWYSIDSPAQEKTITPRTYTMPARPLPPFTVAGSYISAYGAASYSTGVGGTSSGTVTVTANTGPGGLISGTFSFNAVNGAYPYDTTYITAGSFTNVSVATQ